MQFKSLILTGLIITCVVSMFGRVCMAEEEGNVLVKGRGFTVTPGETQLLKARLAPHFGASESEYCRALLKMKLFAKEARALKLDQDPDFQKKLDQIILQEIFNKYVDTLLSSYSLSEEAIESYYFSHQEEFRMENGEIMPLNSKSEKFIKNKIMKLKQAEIIADEFERLMNKYEVEIVDPVCEKKGNAR